MSVVSYWEIIIKSALGKLVAPDDLVEQVSHLSLIWLNVELLHLEALKQLPPIHTDPFDRLLFAQSKATGLTFLTHDSIVKQYHINYRLP